MKRLTLLALPLFAVLALASAQSAQAHSMCQCCCCGNGNGGTPNPTPGSLPSETSMLFTVDLTALDVGLSVSGNAQLSGNTVTLPVTGGSFQASPLSGTLEHDGSGIEFEFDVASIHLEDLEFDFDDALVRADLSSGVIDVHAGVFDMVPCTTGNCTGSNDPTHQFGLFLRPQAADFFENVVFGDEGFDDGDQIALATLGGATPVPEPGILLSLCVALSTLTAVRRRSLN